MRVTVSIPDDVFRAGERLVKRRRITRSRLYTMSVSMYVKAQSGAAVTKKLDRVYGKASSKLEPDLEAATLEFNRRERWD